MGTPTFLFDLDDTLVDSRALLAARQAQDWVQVRAQLGQVRAFGTPNFSPHELPGRLKQKGANVGIVTSSPKWYADAIIARFGIVTDVVIAYGDTTEHKPDPAPIKAALSALGVTEDACYVGDSPDDIEASHHAKIASIGAGWGISDVEDFSRAAPDLNVYDPAILLNDQLDQFSYVGVVRSYGGAPPTLHAGSVLQCGGTPIRYALGRYFATADERHATSRLSANILALKDNDTIADVLGAALADCIIHLRHFMHWSPQYIVPVPPKPGQTRLRFEALLKHTTTLLGANSPTVYLDGLVAQRQIAGYKTMGPADRHAAILGAYSSKYTWNNLNVLLVDDVATTGETVRECAQILLASGASEVRAVVLGKDQRSFTRQLCPACGRPMRVRKRGSDSSSFWGCTGYPNDCQQTVPIS